MGKILLVEDDYALALGTEYALQAEGYQVICANCLQQARAYLKSDVSLLLLDVMLPDGTGYEYCRELRAGGNLVPIIFLTAVTEEANIRRYAIQKGNAKRVCIFGKHRFLIDEFRLLSEEKAVECTPSELRLLKELVLNEGGYCPEDSC